jgi:hypothetical protein
MELLNEFTVDELLIKKCFFIAWAMNGVVFGTGKVLVTPKDILKHIKKYWYHEPISLEEIEHILNLSIEYMARQRNKKGKIIAYRLGGQA